MTYIVQRKDRFYVVAYDGLDPLTGGERRRWHPLSREVFTVDLVRPVPLKHHDGGAVCELVVLMFEYRPHHPPQDLLGLGFGPSLLSDEVC